MIPPSPPSRTSLSSEGRSRHKENLSVTIHADSSYVPKSQFSPETPLLPPSKVSSCSMTKPFRRDNLNRDPSPTTGGFRDRFARFFFGMQTFSGKEPQLLPTQQPKERFENWPPLNVEKRLCTCPNCRGDEKRRRWAIVALIIILLFLLSNVVALNIRVLSVRPPTPSPASANARPSTTSPTALTADTQQCISQYNLNAPANPTSYPCSSCLPLLQGIPAGFPYSNPQDGQTAQNAIQFCGLKSIFDSTGPDGQIALGNAGWLKDVRFCLWKGLDCDGSGRISSLSAQS